MVWRLINSRENLAFSLSLYLCGYARHESNKADVPAAVEVRIANVWHNINSRTRINKQDRIKNALMVQLNAN
jgi:hypothetical protein